MDPAKAQELFISILNQLCLRNTHGKRGLILNDQLEEVLAFLIPYANREIEKLEELGYSYNKGIYFAGNVGSGKTMLMEAYKLFLGTRGIKMGFHYCADMVKAFRNVDKFTNQQDAFAGIDKFANKFDELQRGFDDLGDEDATVNYYGDRIGVMTYILSARHKGIPQGLSKTHLTTNLSSKEIDERYGGRINSRLYEMFNIIQLGVGSDSIDNRKLK